MKSPLGDNININANINVNVNVNVNVGSKDTIQAVTEIVKSGWNQRTAAGQVDDRPPLQRQVVQV